MWKDGFESKWPFHFRTSLYNFLVTPRSANLFSTKLIHGTERKTKMQPAFYFRVIDTWQCVGESFPSIPHLPHAARYFSPFLRSKYHIFHDRLCIALSTQTDGRKIGNFMRIPQQLKRASLANAPPASTKTLSCCLLCMRQHLGNTGTFNQCSRNTIISSNAAFEVLGLICGLNNKERQEYGGV